ncbi:DSS1/SEM1 family-domain-containing protein [Aspergillus recurvatus]
MEYSVSGRRRQLQSGTSPRPGPQQSTCFFSAKHASPFNSKSQLTKAPARLPPIDSFRRRISTRPRFNPHLTSCRSPTAIMSNTQSQDTKQQEASQQPQQQKPTVLEEDDEFEDFPVDDWPENETEQATANGNNVHLWEESWDDDDAAEDFSKQLKEELKKVDASSS